MDKVYAFCGRFRFCGQTFHFSGHFHLFSGHSILFCGQNKEFSGQKHIFCGHFKFCGQTFHFSGHFHLFSGHSLLVCGQKSCVLWTFYNYAQVCTRFVETVILVPPFPKLPTPCTIHKKAHASSPLL